MLFELFIICDKNLRYHQNLEGRRLAILELWTNHRPKTSRSNRTVATQPKLWQIHCVVKTLALEDIYADPHKLDSFIDSGESVEVVRDGRAVAELVPRKAVVESGATSKWPPIDFHARFLRMWGPDAFHSGAPMADLFDELRRQREL